MSVRRPETMSTEPLRTRIERAIRAIAGLPDGCAVIIPVGVLRAWVDADRPDAGDADGRRIADLTCAEAAAELGRRPSTVRTWCASGRIPGAYRLHGREWRIPRAGLRAYLDAQSAGRSRPASARHEERVDLSRWRSVGTGNVFGNKSGER